MERTLTICIPTYNRRDVVVKDINQYLSLDDNRFCIKVSDNCSTDGTYEDLSIINDSRLVLQKNTENIGSVPNWMRVLSHCDSNYLLFLLDKDLIDIKLLPGFIDFLEQDNPNFGYIDLDITKQGGIKVIPSGLKGVKKMCYLDKHPSGYFYKRELFENAVNHPTFQTVDRTFIFPFEILNGSLSVQYSSIIYEWPLIINAAVRDNKDTRTHSFNNSNIWFGEPQRFIEFNYYLDNALHLGLSERDTILLTKQIFSTQLGYVTYVLKSLYKNEEACHHYFVDTREVTFKEMMDNVKKYCCVYYKKTHKRFPFFVIAIIVFFEVLKNLYFSVKSYF